MMAQHPARADVLDDILLGIDDGDGATDIELHSMYECALPVLSVLGRGPDTPLHVIEGVASACDCPIRWQRLRPHRTTPAPLPRHFRLVCS
jgi:hypothetical protein